MSRRAGVLPILLAAWGLGFSPTGLADEPPVKVEPPQLAGSRPVEKTTEAAVLRDYLQAWSSFQEALNANDVTPLDPEFVGTARDKLADTIAAQGKAGIHTRYQVLSHDLHFVFYSPEGQSIELVDTVEYDQQVFGDKKELGTKRVKERFLVVLTPAEVRWRVRVFQGGLPL